MVSWFTEPRKETNHPAIAYLSGLRIVISFVQASTMGSLKIIPPQPSLTLTILHYLRSCLHCCLFASWFLKFLGARLRVRPNVIQLSVNGKITHDPPRLVGGFNRSPKYACQPTIPILGKIKHVWNQRPNGWKTITRILFCFTICLITTKHWLVID